MTTDVVAAAPVIECAWSLMCHRQAVAWWRHEVLGMVPACLVCVPPLESRRIRPDDNIDAALMASAEALARYNGLPAAETAWLVDGETRHALWKDIPTQLAWTQHECGAYGLWFEAVGTVRGVSIQAPNGWGSTNAALIVDHNSGVMRSSRPVPLAHAFRMADLLAALDRAEETDPRRP